MLLIRGSGDGTTSAPRNARREALLMASLTCVLLDEVAAGEGTAGVGWNGLSGPCDGVEPKENLILDAGVFIFSLCSDLFAFTRFCFRSWSAGC